MGKYEAQEKWRSENLRQYAFTLNKKRDEDIIGFIDDNRDTYGMANLMREALQLLMESKGGDMKPAYYREVSYNGDKVEMYDKNFKLIKTLDVFKDKFGTLKLKSARGRRITEGLTRVVKKSDAVEAFLITEPIEGQKLFRKVVGEATDEEA